jgi:hypothetical protein
MTALTLPGGDKPEVARTSCREIAGLISSLGNSFEQTDDAMAKAFWQRQRESQTLRAARAGAGEMSQIERRNKSAQFSAASANLRAEAATLPDDAARPLLALARSFQDRARLFAEGWA